MSPSTSSPTAAKPTTAAQPVVVAQNLKQVYKISHGAFRAADNLQAVSGVSFAVRAGKTLAVVGESGCGKSTLARMVSLIETPTAGQLKLGAIEVTTATPTQRHLCWEPELQTWCSCGLS